MAESAPDPAELSLDQAAAILQVPVSEIASVRRSSRAARRPDFFVIQADASTRPFLEAAVAEIDIDEQDTAQEQTVKPDTPLKRSRSKAKPSTPASSPQDEVAATAAQSEPVASEPLGSPAKRVRRAAKPRRSSQKPAESSRTQEQPDENAAGPSQAAVEEPHPDQARLEAARTAQANGQIKKEYCADAVHVLDGKFYVPEKCRNCVEGNTFCDRGLPCGQCAQAKHACTATWGGRVMVDALPEATFNFVPGTRDTTHDEPLEEKPCIRPYIYRKRDAKKAAVAAAAGKVEASKVWDPRPLPAGEPEVWADERQSVCEALPYYNSYQSAFSGRKGCSFSAMFDAMSGERDYMDENVLITRAGGGMKKNSTGELVQAEDQGAENFQLRSLRAALEQQHPIVLLVGQGNVTCPTIVPKRYCVLDWFFITDIWCEKVSTTWKKMYMYRFQKVDLNKASWWRPVGAPSTPPVPDYSVRAPRAGCIVCRSEYPQTYTAGWMCFNERCAAFWTVDGAAPPLNLRYDPAFLQERIVGPRGFKPPYPLQPPLMQAEGEDHGGISRSRACWKGMVCPRCHGCSSRTEWNRWSCSTKGCGFTHAIPHNVLTSQAVRGKKQFTYTGHALPLNVCAEADGVIQDVRFTPNYRIHTYTLPDIGTITHFMANEVVNKRPNGPDDMFVELQKVDMGLKRIELDESPTAGEILSSHFAVNYGIPYEYVCQVDSNPFAGAPPTILRALHRLSWAGQECITDGSFQKFNELLAIGYCEGQRISYHDDGESTLGPTIATLSLGAPASMTIRMKAGHYFGSLKDKVYDQSKVVLPGCLNYRERWGLTQRHGVEEGREWLALATEEATRNGKKRTAPNLLTMQLHHGDMVVMHGADIQRYYEHAVTPSGRLRFALTSRFVKPEKYPAEVWKGAYDEDPSYHYDGDERSTVEAGAACSFAYPAPEDAAGAGVSDARPAEADLANVLTPLVDAPGSLNMGDSSSLSSLSELGGVPSSDVMLPDAE